MKVQVIKWRSIVSLLIPGAVHVERSLCRGNSPSLLLAVTSRWFWKQNLKKNYIETKRRNGSNQQVRIQDFWPGDLDPKIPDSHVQKGNLQCWPASNARILNIFCLVLLAFHEAGSFQALDLLHSPLSIPLDFPFTFTHWIIKSRKFVCSSSQTSQQNVLTREWICWPAETPDTPSVQYQSAWRAISPGLDRCSLTSCKAIERFHKCWLNRKYSAWKESDMKCYENGSFIGHSLWFQLQ